MSDNSLTPMMKQYHAIRRELPPDVLLFFRLGDFYELFFEDAKTAAPILNVALTKRNEIPMCGIPYHAAQGYIARLIQAEKRVAIAEQTSEPQPGKLVERQLSQIITASTFDQDNLLDAGRSQYLAAIYQEGKKWGLAWADLTTGDFRLAEFNNPAPLCDEIHRLAPREILASAAQIPLLQKLMGEQAILQETDSYCFLPEQAQHLLLTHFQTHSLDGFGCQNMSSAIGAAGAVLHYLQYQLRRKVDHFRRLQVSDQGNHVLIDAASQINLEIVQNRSDGRSLLKTLDRTRTPMGARLLRDWLLHPLRDLPTLLDRQALIGACVEDPLTLHQIRDTLSAVRDVERTLGRLTQGNGNARDLLILGQSLSRTHILRQLLQSQESLAPLAGKITAHLHDFTDFTGYLHAALADEPPATIKEGGIFKPGFLPLLDELREASRSGKQWIADSPGTGNRTHRHQIPQNPPQRRLWILTSKSPKPTSPRPEDYTRKQTTVNAERFITPEFGKWKKNPRGADETRPRIQGMARTARF
jgi:DNA mismatch repair protein MutS